MDKQRNASALRLIEWSGRTDCGPRANNEDVFLGLQFDGREVRLLGKYGQASASTTDFAFAVCDGMGGAKSGEFASRIASEKIMALLPRSFQLSASGFKTDFVDVLNELFGEIHHALAYVGSCYEECSGMETTLSLCWFTPGCMYFGHIGDSRIYYLSARSGAIKQLTEDDTHVGWLLRTGKINEREARNHPRRRVLQRALGGSNQFVTPQVGSVAYEPGDTFLLCTDGLVEGLYDSHLLEMLRPAQPAEIQANPADALVTAALAGGSRDNTTALVCRV